VAVVVDITARRRADALAAGGGAAIDEALERAPIGTGLLDAEGRWLLVNRPLCDITGYTADELIGTRFDGIVHPEDTDNDAEERARLLAGEIPAFQTEKRYFDAAGETASAILSVSLVRDRGGAPLHYVAQLQDVSERKRLEQSVRDLADHDPLTGLRNRRLFEQDLMLQVARSQRYGETAGLLVIDLDAFAQLNKKHGPAAGDAILKALARALTRRLRQTDLVARLATDEFAVLLPHIDVEGITVVADGLLRVIPAYSVDTGAAVLHPSASIGSALIDRRTATAQQALAEAYRAMQIAKYAKPSSAS
jgi:diguanylate cyclase (GGDEF)-like protein/PAS domain S-box-containing protein